jgi:hypothetical protein
MMMLDGSVTPVQSNAFATPLPMMEQRTSVGTKAERRMQTSRVTQEVGAAFANILRRSRLSMSVTQRSGEIRLSLPLPVADNFLTLSATLC